MEDVFLKGFLGAPAGRAQEKWMKRMEESYQKGLNILWPFYSRRTFLESFKNLYCYPYSFQTVSLIPRLKWCRIFGCCKRQFIWLLNSISVSSGFWAERIKGKSYSQSSVRSLFPPTPGDEPVARFISMCLCDWKWPAPRLPNLARNRSSLQRPEKVPPSVRQLIKTSAGILWS